MTAERAQNWEYKHKIKIRIFFILIKCECDSENRNKKTILQDVKNEQHIFILLNFQDLIKQFPSFFESQVYENKKI